MRKKEKSKHKKNSEELIVNSEKLNVRAGLVSAHGITLISLVITIVILIILAGIAINLSLGENGIFTRAKQARDMYLTAAEEEQKNLNELEEYLEDGGNNWDSSESTSSDIENFTPIIKECNGNYIEVEVPEIEVSNSNSIVGYAFLINDEVVEYTKEKQYIYKDLEFNSTYNISVIAMDKKGRIKKSSVVTQKTLDKLLLYSDGNEYKNITNGWIGTSVYGYGTSYGQYIRGENYLYVKNTSTESSGSSNYAPSWMINNAIDISKYKKIVIEGEFIVPPSTGIGIIIGQNKSNFLNGIYAAEGKNENANRIEYDCTKYNLDFSKPYYIAIYCLNSNYNNHTEATIRKVWLEK